MFPPFYYPMVITNKHCFDYDKFMMTPPNDLNPDDRAKCEQNGWIAYDPKTRSMLRKTSEEVKPGQPSKYYFYIPSLMLRVIWAKTDQEAIDDANIAGK